MYIRERTLNGRINLDWEKAFHQDKGDKPHTPFYAYLGVFAVLSVPALILLTRYLDERRS